jgi:excisionase family DNA binding protein
MGIRRLPSGTFQVRFQHHRTSYVATYPTRELAEEAEPLLRAAVLTGHDDETDTDRDTNVPPPTGPAPGSRPAPTPEQARASSAAAAQLMDEILAGVVHDAVDRVPQPDQVLTTGQAAVLLGVSRPTVVSWLEAGRFPFHWRGTHRRVHRVDVLAYHDRRRRCGDNREL